MVFTSFVYTMLKRKDQDNEHERITKKQRKDQDIDEKIVEKIVKKNIFIPIEILVMMFSAIFENKHETIRIFNNIRLASKDFNAIISYIIRGYYSREFGFKIMDQGAIWHDLINSSLLFTLSCENERDLGSIDFSLRYNVTYLLNSLSSEFSLKFSLYGYALIHGRRIFQKNFRKNYIMSHNDYFHGGEEMVTFFCLFSKKHHLGNYYSYSLRKVNRARPMFPINLFKKFHIEHKREGSRYVNMWETRCSLSLLKEWFPVREKCCVENILKYK